MATVTTAASADATARAHLFAPIMLGDIEFHTGSTPSSTLSARWRD